MSADFYDLLERPSWHARAACRGMGTELFYPNKGEGGGKYRIIKELCASCPVRAECAEAGINELHGTWGGTNPKDRRRLRAPGPSRWADHLLAPCGTNAAYNRHIKKGEKACEACKKANALARRGTPRGEPITL